MISNSSVEGALYFKKVGNADDHMKKIVLRAEAALRRIAAESPMNAQRVKNFGVNLEEYPKPIADIEDVADDKEY